MRLAALFVVAFLASLSGLLLTFLVLAALILAPRHFLLLLALARLALLLARIVLLLITHGDTVLLLPALGERTEPRDCRSCGTTATGSKTP